MTASKSDAEINYQTYLQLDKLLDCQKLLGEKKEKAHDQHLFIVIHQAYELWFKQILFEIDSIREIFQATRMDESKTLIIIRRLGRIALILKLLVEQIHILETMTPFDFLEFRNALGTASGFQSLQFRLIENKLGIKEEQRICYNSTSYKDAFKNQTELAKPLDDSTRELSLSALVQAWLERTPGLDKCGYDFWNKFHDGADYWITDLYTEAMEKATSDEQKEIANAEFKKRQEIFNSIFDENVYKSYVEKGERRFSYRAFQGAMMVYLYRDEPRFHQPFQLLNLLIDIDSHLTKWRYNHVMLVQRMLGNKIGTGGSSGYQYLRSTVSDRYKIFIDLFNLSTFIIPRSYIPPLSSAMKRTLSVFMREGLVSNGLEAMNLSESSNYSHSDEEASTSPKEGLMFY